MSPTPDCERCGKPKRQPGRYADWVCPCCDESATCPHVKPWTRWMRKLAGRKV